MVLDEKIKAELEEYLKKREAERRGKPIVRKYGGEDSLIRTELSPGDIAQMKAEAKEKQKELDEKWKADKEYADKYIEKLVFPTWKCPECEHEQIARPQGEYSLDAVIVDFSLMQLPCSKCGKTFLMLRWGKIFEMHYYGGINPSQFTLEGVNSEVAKIEKNLNRPKSLLDKLLGR